MPYTDCLLRHIHTHRYVAVWDIDEFILPVTHWSLPALVDAAKARASSLGLSPTSYLARCTYFFDDLVEEPSPDLPEHLHLLRHVMRSVVGDVRIYVRILQLHLYDLGGFGR